MEIYLVGGSVRDKLLGKLPNDLDYVVLGSKRSELLELGYKSVGKGFEVFLKNGNEYALARTEKSTGISHTDFTCNYEQVSLKEDLSRRDLTINAMAEDKNGQIIDYFGGQKDLENKTLRHINNAFADDPLRVLRVARFAAELGFRVDASTLELMRQIVNGGMLEHLTPGRVWKETERALAAKNLRKYFEVLDSCGALQVVFPELYALKGIAQPAKYHPEGDAWQHTLLVLDEITKYSNDPVTRFGALVHDIGKAIKPMYAHPENGVVIVKQMAKRLKLPRKYKEMGVLAAGYHMYFHKLNELKASTILKWFGYARAYRNKSRFKQLLFISLADNNGRGQSENIKSSLGFKKLNLIMEMLAEIDRIDYKELQITAKTQNHFLQLIHKKRLGIIKTKQAKLKNLEN